MIVRSRSGLTLLELLLVIFLLSAVAASAVSLVDDADGQARFELTKSRREQIREAILGDGSTVNGQPLARGFLNDMGRLPENLRELVVPVQADGSPITAWDPLESRGWRGPYLRPDYELIGGQYTPVFRDGWKNVSSADDAVNFGWQFLMPGSALSLQSLGSDGVPGVTTASPLYEADLPADSYAGLISANDWRFSLAGHAVSVNITNKTGTDLDTQAWLRVRVPVPNASGWSDGDAHRVELKDSFMTPVNLVLADGDTGTFQFEFEPGDFSPHGQRVFEVVQMQVEDVVGVSDPQPLIVGASAPATLALTLEPEDTP